MLIGLIYYCMPQITFFYSILYVVNSPFNLYKKQKLQTTDNANFESTNLVRMVFKLSHTGDQEMAQQFRALADSLEESLMW